MTTTNARKSVSKAAMPVLTPRMEEHRCEGTPRMEGHWCKEVDEHRLLLLSSLDMLPSLYGGAMEGFHQVGGTLACTGCQ
jgi:hypothetical protein